MSWLAPQRLHVLLLSLTFCMFWSSTIMHSFQSSFQHKFYILLQWGSLIRAGPRFGLSTPASKPGRILIGPRLIFQARPTVGCAQIRLGLARSMSITTRETKIVLMNIKLNSAFNYDFALRPMWSYLKFDFYFGNIIIR